jgi:hypothetical protein
MKRILYANGGFLTDDTVADALMDYASVLAIVGSADVISCPGLDEQGKLRRIQMLIGPASQILAMSTDDPPRQMDADEAVAELRRRAAARLPDSIDVGEAGTRRAESDAESTTHE